MKLEEIRHLVGNYRAYQRLGQSERNSLLYYTFLLLQNQLVEGTRREQGRDSQLIVQVPIDASRSPDRIEDLTKGLLLYSDRVLFLVEESFGYMKNYSARLESSKDSNLSDPQAFFYPDGSLPLAWFFDLLEKLAEPIVAGLVCVVPSYLARRVYDEFDAVGSEGLVAQAENDFVSLLSITEALPLIEQGKHVRTIRKQTAATLAATVSWHDIDLVRHYWQHLFADMGLPYLTDMPMHDVLNFRDSERAIFEKFTSRVARRLRELPVGGSEAAIKDAVQETLEGFVEIQEQFDRKMRESAFLSALSAAALSLTALTFVPHGVPPEAATIFGSGSFAGLVAKAASWTDAKSKRRLHPYYVPLRVTEFLEKNRN